MIQLTTNLPAFQQALLDWYTGAQRPLPWRTEPSLYRTVVSELMAQQTQIKTMLPYFERWMQRFPDFEALAAAPTEDVLKHWEGLGYYSRARNLHKLAKEYVIRAPKPTTRAEWQLLPGIGPYTSAAISSICFDDPAAVVDGNVVRILARLTADQRSFKNNGEAVKALTPLAGEVLNAEHPGDHNQAMMELGATLCQKHNPLCTVCPVVKFCQGAAKGEPGALPKIERAATKKVEVDRVWMQHEGKILLHRIPEDAQQLAGQYELPTLQHLDLKRPRTQPLLTKSRGITNKRITERIHSVPMQAIKHAPDSSHSCQSERESPDSHLKPNLPTPPQDCHWIPVTDLDRITLSGPHRRWVKELLLNL